MVILKQFHNRALEYPYTHIPRSTKLENGNIFVGKNDTQVEALLGHKVIARDGFIVFFTKEAYVKHLLFKKKNNCLNASEAKGLIISSRKKCDKQCKRVCNSIEHQDIVTVCIFLLNLYIAKNCPYIKALPSLNICCVRQLEQSDCLFLKNYNLDCCLTTNKREIEKIYCAIEVENKELSDNTEEKLLDVLSYMPSDFEMFVIMHDSSKMPNYRLDMLSDKADYTLQDLGIEIRKCFLKGGRLCYTYDTVINSVGFDLADIAKAFK